MKKIKSTRTADDEEMLESWRQLLKHVYSLNEHELAQLLQKEYTGLRRKAFVTMIHQRMNRLRGKRERQQLKQPGFTFNFLEGVSL